MLSLLCLPPTLAGTDLTPYELVSLLDELPSLQSLVLHHCASSSLYVSCFFSVQSAVDTLCVYYYLLCTLTGW